MGKSLQIWNASATQINIYYLFVILSFFYFTIKYRNHLFLIYVILIFYTGLFSFLGKNIADLYKIIILGFSLYWIFKTNPIVLNRKTLPVIISFTLFTTAFFITAYVNNDYFTITFSQYSRYFVFVILFFVLRKYQNNSNFKIPLDRLIVEILLVQIVLSAIKILIMGGPREGLVGTITAQGGAAATSLPLLGFIFYWLLKKGKFSRKDWYYIFGLIFIGFAGGKRAIWFIMPVIIAAFIYYVPKHAIPIKYLISTLFIVPLIFYFGLRLSPSLNPDHKIWGSFDLQYTIDYVDYYNVGEFENDEAPKRGRVNSTLFVFQDLFTQDIAKTDWYGSGLRFMYASNFEEFSQMGFDITHKGSATGVYQTLIANGYMGVFTFLFFATSLILFTKHKGIRNVLLFLFLWEYLFYTGIILREYSLAFLLIYIIVFSKYEIPNQTNKKVVLKPSI